MHFPNAQNPRGRISIEYNIESIHWKQGKKMGKKTDISLRKQGINWFLHLWHKPYVNSEYRDKIRQKILGKPFAKRPSLFALILLKYVSSQP